MCSNYKGIKVLSLPGKVYVGVLEKKIRLIVEPQEEQSVGSVLDQLHTLTRVQEATWELAQPVHTCFVDLEKTLGRAPRCVLLGGSPGLWGTGSVTTATNRKGVWLPFVTDSAQTFYRQNLKVQLRSGEVLVR